MMDLKANRVLDIQLVQEHNYTMKTFFLFSQILFTNLSKSVCSFTVHFRVAFYCDQPEAHLCNNHAV